MSSYEARVAAAAQDQLVGKKIVSVLYMDQESADELGWSYRGVVITLEDGTQLYPSADDEGNNAGALFTSLEGELSTIGVINTY